jgi:preprotein translocase subunit SecA
MQRIGMEEGVPIEHTMVTKAIARAQKQVEAQNFSTRKHLLEYDDVMNKQRENVYSLRRELLEGKIKIDEGEALDTRGYLMSLADDLVQNLVDTHAAKDTNPEEWDFGALRRAAADLFAIDAATLDAIDLEKMPADDMAETLYRLVTERYAEKETGSGIDASVWRRVERDIMLQIVDAQWKDHLYSLDHLKEGIGLRGYGQRDPLVEYKRESFALFQAMKDRIDEEMVRYLWRLRPVEQQGGDAAAPAIPVPKAPRRPPQITMSGGSSSSGAMTSSSASRQPSTSAPPPARTGGDDAPVKTVRRDEPKIGRNDPCWCGSGKKYKKCHGA